MVQLTNYIRTANCSPLCMATGHIYFCSQMYTVRHKKLHHFVFAITLSYLSLFEYLLVHIYHDKFTAECDGKRILKIG